MIATVVLAAKLQLSVDVIATVPMAENMPSATAQRPGSVRAQGRAPPQRPSPARARRWSRSRLAAAAAGAEAANKFLARVWRLADEPGEGGDDPDLTRAAHRAIADVTKAIEGFAFNKAVAKIYELANAVGKSKAGGEARRAVLRILAQLMAPMVPHLAEDVWAMAGGAGLAVDAPWPKADPAMLVEDSVTLPIQINGKRRGEIAVPRDMAAPEVEALVLADAAIQRFLDGKPPKKLIVVPGRIVNVVA